MSLSVLPPMPRFATITDTPTRPADPILIPMPRAVRKEDVLLYVPPAARISPLAETEREAETSSKDAPDTLPDLTDDDLTFMRHIVDTPGAHCCPPSEGCVLPRGLLGTLLGHLENNAKGQLPERLRERVESLVRNAFHDAFVAVGGTSSLLVVQSVFNESPTKARMDSLLAQIPPD